MDDREQRVIDAIAAGRDELVGLVTDLVGFDTTSRNSNLPLIGWIEDYLDRHGVAHERIPDASGMKSNVWATIGPAAAPGYILSGHTDTVPPDALSLWSVDPFGGEVRDGAVWGRGALDMKGGLVCQIACAHVLSRMELRGSLVLHFAAGEERGEPGTLSLLENGFGGDLGIVTEPTRLEVSVATRGVAWLVVRIRGHSIHASRGHLGVNPLLRLGPVLGGLRPIYQDYRSNPFDRR